MRTELGNLYMDARAVGRGDPLVPRGARASTPRTPTCAPTSGPASCTPAGPRRASSSSRRCSRRSPTTATRSSTAASRSCNMGRSAEAADVWQALLAALPRRPAAAAAARPDRRAAGRGGARRCRGPAREGPLMRAIVFFLQFLFWLLRRAPRHAHARSGVLVGGGPAPQRPAAPRAAAPRPDRGPRSRPRLPAPTYPARARSRARRGREEHFCSEACRDKAKAAVARAS